MKVLLLHPEDLPWSGAWSRERWDLVVDLGFASPFVYEEWTRKLGARVVSVYQYDGPMEGYRWVSQVLEHGRGRLLDRIGLDWWELLAVWSYQELHALYLLDNVARREISSGRAEVATTRPHLFSRILGEVLACPVRSFRVKSGPAQRVSRMLRSARKLRPAQIAEIAFDKWDAAYRIRRHFKKGSQARLSEPAVLLPSTYSNVTRAELAYAGQLPHRRFLLAATRRSALLEACPENVATTSLAAYALPSSLTHAESAELCSAWETFRRTTLLEVKEFRIADGAGLWDYFPANLENGLRLREAWRHLLEREPVTGVLCGDDLNYYTRLPLILAQRNGLRAVYCSHGALDGGFLFKLPQADSFLVKGEMERDYLQRARAIEPEKILVGAPGRNEMYDESERHPEALVFFSQPYEVEGGRAEEIYRELLPRLHSAATRSGRKVVVKLHPFESVRARRALVDSILPAAAARQVEIVAGTRPEEVMARAWCGITVDSSVAVECALRGIPFFLCGWLDFSGMGYLRQFARFGVARVLNGPQEIEQIPEMVGAHRADPAILQRLWHKADCVQLDELMFGARQARLDRCAC